MRVLAPITTEPASRMKASWPYSNSISDSFFRRSANMSSISGVTSVSSAYASSSIGRGHRPDPAKMAEDIFSKLDTKGQGYIEKSDLQTALNSVSGKSSTSSASSDADELFSQLDSDSDGKVTKSELADSMQKLADALDSQAMSSRMGLGGMGHQGGAGGMPPPPPSGQGGPGGQDAGMTKDELTSVSSKLAATDSQASSLMSKVASNFDKADTDGDGKVSFKEAMAYEQSSQSDSTSTTSSTTSADTSSTAAASQSQDSQARMLQQLMQLVRAYGSGQDGESGDSRSSGLSAIA